MTSNLLLKARPTVTTDWRKALGELARTLGFSIDACCEALLDGEVYAYLAAAGDAAALAQIGRAHV